MILVGQNRLSFEEFNKDRQNRFDNFNEARRKRFEEFRRQRNEEFAKYIRKDWIEVNPSPVIPKPKDETLPPVIKPKDDVIDVSPVVNPVPYEDVIPSPIPVPQPAPIDPILEIPVEPTPIEPINPVPAPPEYKKIEFSFLGTPASVRIAEKDLFKLTSLDENSIAEAWLKLSEESYTNLLYDCLKIREDFHLDDWPYLLMLNQMADAVFGKGSNESVLLMAYAFCQSGYKMRMATDDVKLYMLFASEHTIYNWDFFSIDNQNYYVFGNVDNKLRICNQNYPKERSLSLLIIRQPHLNYAVAGERSHKSTRDADMNFSIAANNNMLKLYDSYPSSKINDNFMTRWAMYANLPMPDYIRNSLYPQIRQRIDGMDQLKALNKILHWVQTGFEYEYDDKVWGCDRAFFPEESLYYPYCDCEDRSILFTRIVRDILGLKCVLVYYPGHLASAVALTQGSPTGDYFDYGGLRFFVADGTIMGYGASVGETMSRMDNKTAKLILLDNN